ncbi:uncharacterized protein LOC135373765 [Ornithodoros turicata]|uniref:uncharacterized protein LOC135373765 n=1 Tax=Ornithodoros turicata TaxID=34597 RepID=UPI003139EC41
MEVAVPAISTVQLSEASPMKDSTAETIAHTFLSTWISRFGVPEEVVTDRGPRFESHLFVAFLPLLGTERIRTSAYHPACNGLVERFHRHLKQAIMAHGDRVSWSDHFPSILLGIRAAAKVDLGCSSAELVYGTPLRLPADIFVPSSVPCTDQPAYLARLRQAFATLQFTPTRAVASSPPFVPLELCTTSHVFLRTDRLRRALEPPYSGRYKVLRRSPKTFVTMSTASRNLSPSTGSSLPSLTTLLPFPPSPDKPFQHLLRQYM